MDTDDVSRGVGKLLFKTNGLHLRHNSQAMNGIRIYFQSLVINETSFLDVCALGH